MSSAETPCTTNPASVDDRMITKDGVTVDFGQTVWDGLARECRVTGIPKGFVFGTTVDGGLAGFEVRECYSTEFRAVMARGYAIAEEIEILMAEGAALSKRLFAMPVSKAF